MINTKSGVMNIFIYHIEKKLEARWNFYDYLDSDNWNKDLFLLKMW